MACPLTYLEARAVVGKLADPVEHLVDNLLADGVVAWSEKLQDVDKSTARQAERALELCLTEVERRGRTTTR